MHKTYEGDIPSELKTKPQKQKHDKQNNNTHSGTFLKQCQIFKSIGFPLNYIKPSLKQKLVKILRRKFL